LKKETQDSKTGWFRIKNNSTNPIIIPVEDDMISVHREHQFVRTWKMNISKQENGWTVIPYEFSGGTLADYLIQT
jgi:aryl-phospho-beta-D-glucosidase BglC (GH1 family)